MKNLYVICIRTLESDKNYYILLAHSTNDLRSILQRIHIIAIGALETHEHYMHFIKDNNSSTIVYEVVKILFYLMTQSVIELNSESMQWTTFAMMPENHYQGWFCERTEDKKKADLSRNINPFYNVNNVNVFFFQICSHMNMV